MESKTRTASRTIATKWVREILDGKFTSGEKLPTERHMAEKLGVSRNVIREALKRLEAMGLIRIRQGSGAYIEDLQQAGGLELLEYLLFVDGNRLDPVILADLFVFLRHFFREVIRLVVRNRTEEELKQLHAVMLERDQALDDLDKLVEVNQRALDIMARATHNRVYQLLFCNVSRFSICIRQLFPLQLIRPLPSPEYLVGIYETIESQNEEKAVELVAELIEYEYRNLLPLLEFLGLPKTHPSL